MDYFLTEEQKMIQDLAREIAHDKIKPIAAQHDETGEFPWDTMKILADAGFFGLYIDENYGGAGCGIFELVLATEELSRACGGIAVCYAGSALGTFPILLHGSEEQKNKYLPRIASGEIEFSMGYTEPQAGSDLASLSLRAEDKGDYYLINGQKMFSTKADFADYGWLAVRTDPDNPKKHKGISLLIFDLKNTPGVTIRPIYNMSGYHSCEVFYDDVHIPKENLVGELNQGFYIIGAALLFERAVTVGGFYRPLELLVDYVKNTKRHGRPLSEDPLVRRKLAEIEMKFAVTKAVSQRLCWMQEHKMFALNETAMAKLISTEMVYDLANAGMQVMGPYGELVSDSKYAALQGWFAHIYQESPHYKIAGGTSEIQRQIIATRGLGLPRG